MSWTGTWLLYPARRSKSNSMYDWLILLLVQIALNQAIKAAEEGENAEGEISLDDLIKEPVLQRTRKRPKREV